MRVAVCCRGVPIECHLENVKVVNGDIHFRDTELYISEFDEYALEAAVALKKSHGMDTLALTVGPLRALEVLHIASCKGIDQVMRIDGETSRPELVAYALLPPLREIAPQLILVGVQSEDWMGGEVGIYLSEGLNMAVAFAVIEITKVNDIAVTVKKEIGGGRKAEVELRLPAVLCVQSGIQPLHYLSNLKLRKARAKTVALGRKLDMGGVKEAIGGLMAYHIKEVCLPPKKRRAQMISGDQSEKAAKVLEVISKRI